MFELIRKQDDEIVESGAWNTISGDAGDVLDELSDSALSIAGYELAQSRRLELFDRLRKAGASIKSAAEQTGVSVGLGHKHEVENIHGRTFTTAAQKESKVRDAIEESPDASNREIAKRTGVSHPTVASIRRRPAPKPDDVASGGEITGSRA